MQMTTERSSRPALARFALATAATLFLLFGLQSAHAADKPKVITTFTVIADMARNVAGDAAVVESITKPGSEIHNYQPTPRDIVKTQDADLVLWNGLNLEAWFEKFFANLDGVPSAIVSEGVVPIGIGEGPYKDKPNPHAWMSIDNALIYVENIREALTQIDPDNAAVYAANAERYSAEIKAVAEPIRKTIAQVPEESRWLASSEGAFSYLARDLGLRELYIWPINADQQGTPQQVRKVIDAIRANKVPAVFSESTVPDDAAKQIARETGIRYGGVLYVDSLSEEGGPVPTYVDLLKVTTETIAAGLTGAAIQ
jgi:manganese/iron transport system substrate-binding protein